MWDQQGNNPQGNALEEALGDVMFNPVTTLLPIRLGSRQGDKDSTIDLALVSPRISPWLNADYTDTTRQRPSAGCIQPTKKTPAKKPNVKPNNLSRYEQSGSDVVSKLSERKPRTQHTKGSRKSPNQLQWWYSETEKAWTEKRAAVKSW